MKVCLLGDVHFGVSNSKEHILNTQLAYFEYELFPYLEENSIDTIIQLGDLFDNRFNLNSNMLIQVKKRFFDNLKKYNIKMYMIIGNHDIFEKDSNDKHSSFLFESLYPDNFKVYTKTTFLKLSGKNLLMVPWLLPDTKFKVSNFPGADFIFGHFEMINVEMIKGIDCKSAHALDMDNFQNIKTFSGHFHLKRYYPEKNVYYIGNAVAQISWADYNEEKGVHILNLEDGTFTFVESKTGSKHIEITINAEEKSMLVEGFSEGILQADINSKLDYTIFKNHNVKIYITKDNAYTKKVIEKIVKQVNKYKVKISTVELEDGNLEETPNQKIDLKEFDITGSIKERLDTDYKIDIFSKIHEETLKQFEG